MNLHVEGYLPLQMAGVAFEVATLAQKPKIQKKMASAFMDEVKRDLLVNLAFKKAGDDLK